MLTSINRYSFIKVLEDVYCYYTIFIERQQLMLLRSKSKAIYPLTFTHNIKYGIHKLRSTMKKKKVALNSWGDYDVFLWRRRCFQIVVLVCLLIQRREKAFTVFEPIVGYCDYIIVMLCIDEGLFTFFDVVLYGCLFLVLNIDCICSKMYLIECNTRLIR